MPTSFIRLCLAALLLAAARPVTSTAQPTGLSTTERSITRAVDAHNASTLALLERLVNINSGTQNFAGVRQVGDLLRAQFDSLGFRTRWVDGAPFNRAGHLVARAIERCAVDPSCSKAERIELSAEEVADLSHTGEVLGAAVDVDQPFE